MGQMLVIPALGREVSAQDHPPLQLVKAGLDSVASLSETEGPSCGC